MASIGSEVRRATAIRIDSEEARTSSTAVVKQSGCSLLLPLHAGKLYSLVKWWVRNGVAGWRFLRYAVCLLGSVSCVCVEFKAELENSEAYAC